MTTIKEHRNVGVLSAIRIINKTVQVDKGLQVSSSRNSGERDANKYTRRAPRDTHKQGHCEAGTREREGVRERLADKHTQRARWVPFVSERVCNVASSVNRESERM